MKNFLSILCFLVSAKLYAQPAANPVPSDTARDVAYLSSNEKDIVRILNEARLNPPVFAQQNLNVSAPAGSAEAECYAEMIKLSPLQPLKPSRALSLSAKAHAKDMGYNGLQGHEGSDKSTLADRIARQGKYTGAVAENCSYGLSQPLETVKQLLIDDGVADRGHRKNILSAEMNFVGVSIQPHASKYQQNTVMDFAEIIAEKHTGPPPSPKPPASQPTLPPAPKKQSQNDIEAIKTKARELGIPPALADQYLRAIGKSSPTSQPSDQPLVFSVLLDDIRKKAEVLGIPTDVINEFLKYQRPKMSKGDLVDMVSRMDNKKIVKLMDKIGVVPNLGIQQRRPFWQLGMGPHNVPLPVDSVTLPRLNFAYVWVDESVIQLYEVKLSLSAQNQIVDLGYGIGFGGSFGFWHIGLLANLGYAHLYTEPQGNIHGLNYSLQPFFNFGLPFLKWLNSWRFHISGGWTGIAASNATYRGVHQLDGWILEFGLGFSIQ